MEHWTSTFDGILHLHRDAFVSASGNPTRRRKIVKTVKRGIKAAVALRADSPLSLPENLSKVILIYFYTLLLNNGRDIRKSSNITSNPSQIQRARERRKRNWKIARRKMKL